MLKIAPETFSRMAAVEEGRFVARVAAFLRANVPTLAAEPEPAMHEQVNALLHAARGYGLTSERAVATFALTAALLGLDFAERFGGARQILHSAYAGDRKAELLEGFTMTLFQTLAG